MMGTRSAIPEDVKRKVRQKCYFGCIHCGVPLVDYHHIQKYADVQSHDVDNMVLLCPTCHRRLHAGLYSSEDYEKDIITPYNSIHLSAHDFFVTPKEENHYIIIGGSTFKNTPTILEYNGERIFWCNYDEDDHLLFNAKFFNRKGKLIAEVKDNEWKTYIKDGMWDFTYQGGVLKINSAPNKIDLILSIKESGIELKCNMLIGGIPFIINENEIVVGNTVLKVCSLENSKCAISINT